RVFDDEEFSLDEFRATFPTPQAPKVIHDLITQGYLERVSRGNYRTVEPRNLIHRLTRPQKGDILKEASREYAYCASNAVAIWTEGYYWTGFTKGFKPRHIKVKEADLDYWERFFKGKGVHFAVEGESKTLYGVVYILHPEEDFEVVYKDGLKVIPLEEAAAYCLARELIYQPALEYLEQRYEIGELVPGKSREKSIATRRPYHRVRP
ncbi:MAG: hypothetical protein U9Q76_08695, partial [candidate division WOR-3 bacterium]|nr:hypothetical protein [candidate division WOR-3 bacterium]